MPMRIIVSGYGWPSLGYNKYNSELAERLAVAKEVDDGS
jgi:hypothetical protein